MVTGGAGFIGHHLVDALLSDGHEVVSLDRLDCSGNLNRLAELVSVRTANGSFRQFYHDLKAELSGQKAQQLGSFDWVLHLAASSHVDRSIQDPASFVLDNVLGTTHALLFARDIGAKFLYFSTDEVFGPAPEGVNYKEWDRYRSGNPYAASKAGGEEMAVAFANTYRMHVVATHTMNVIGLRQAPEKFVPSCIRKIKANEVVTIHSDKTRTKAGSRFYIDAAEVARAVMFVMERGESGEKYNIVGEREMDNLEMARKIALAVNKDLFFEMVDFHGSRPGHDLRYALDGSKLDNLGFARGGTIDMSIAKIVQWSLDNQQWL